jgi:hypothetical protein
VRLPRHLCSLIHCTLVCNNGVVPTESSRVRSMNLQENHFQVTPHDVSELAGLRQVSPTTMSLSSIRASMR